MSGGSLQVRRFVAAMRAGVPIEECAQLNGIGLAKRGATKPTKRKACSIGSGPHQRPRKSGIIRGRMRR